MFDTVEAAILSSVGEAAAMGAAVVAAVLGLVVGLKLLKKVTGRAS